MRAFLFFAFCLVATPLFSAIRTCGTSGVDDTCLPADMVTVLGASSDGDVIQIEPGTHDWSTTGNDPIGVVVTKRVTISGGGTCTDCGDTYTPAGTWPVVLTTGTGRLTQQFFVNITTPGSEIFRMTGIHFQGETYFQYNWFSDSPGGFCMVASSNIAVYRFDNNFMEITNPPDEYDASGIQAHCQTYGLIDNNYFLCTGNDGHHVTIYRLEPDGSGPAWDVMTEPLSYGQDNFTFIEDNTSFFTCFGPDPDGVFGSGMMDVFNGGRVVYRYNYQEGGAALTIHGLSGGYPTRSGHMVEVYNNFFNFLECLPLNANYVGALTWRGGTMFVHNNVVQDGIQNMLKVFNERVGCTIGVNCPAGWVRCDNTPLQVWDGAGSPLGYPCIDNPGRSISPGTTDATIGNQVLTPGRMWLNTGTNEGGCAGTVEHGGWICNASGGYTVDGVDYIFSTDDSAKPGDYTEYTYPHPLQSGGATPTNIPSAPTALGITVVR